MNELTVQNHEVAEYNDEQVKLIKDMYAKKATDNELKLLMYMSSKYSLDILTKQIWCVKFGEAAAQIYAGRDGFLEVGHRSGQFNGMETKTVKINEPISIGFTGWVNGKKQTNTFKSDFQFVSTCTVFRKDMDHPIEVEVYEEEYSTGQNLWATKRRTMTAKVAESQCLRKAFSISGLYSPEEIYQGEVIHNTEIIEDAPIDVKIDNTKVEFIKSMIVKSATKEESFLKWAKVEKVEDILMTDFKVKADMLERAVKEYEEKNKKDELGDF